MKRFLFSIIALLGLVTVAEANGFAGAAFRFRAPRQRVVIRQQFAAPAYYQPVQQVRIQSFSYGYAAPIRIVQPFSYGYGVQQLNVEAGCGCNGASQFRSRALLGYGFGY